MSGVAILFKIYFLGSWTNASKKREKLLENNHSSCRRWQRWCDGTQSIEPPLESSPHSDDVPVDIMDLALNAHIKILDYSCSQVRVCCLAHFLWPSSFTMRMAFRYRIVLGFLTLFLSDLKLTYLVHVSLPSCLLCLKFSATSSENILVFLVEEQYK